MSDGASEIDSSISDIACGREDSMARRNPGMASHDWRMNTKLRIVADLSLDKEMLALSGADSQTCGFKPDSRPLADSGRSGRTPPKALRPVRKRKLVDEMRGDWDVSLRRACRVFLVDTSTYHYKPRRAGGKGGKDRYVMLFVIGSGKLTRPAP